MPPQRKQRLSHRSIFILPSGTGIAYLLMCLILFLLGTNYQNNLILVLAFLLISLFHTSVLMAFRNLAGLTLEAGQEIPCHQGEAASFPIQLHSKRRRHQLTLRFSQGSESTTDVSPDQDNCCELQACSEQRGRFNPQRITIESRYPLGLCRVWSVQDLNLTAIIWPKPLAGPVGFAAGEHSHHDTDERVQSGLDDFNGLERWQPGDSRSRIAWKQLAQTGQWQIKQFVEPQSSPQTLLLNPNLELESALSHLTAKLLDMERQRSSYALQLGDEQIELGNGSLHLQRCLNALALYKATP